MLMLKIALCVVCMAVLAYVLCIMDTTTTNEGEDDWLQEDDEDDDRPRQA